MTNATCRVFAGILGLLAVPAVAAADLRMVRPVQSFPLTGFESHPAGLAATASGYFLVTAERVGTSECTLGGWLLNQDGAPVSQFPVRDTALEFCDYDEGNAAVTTEGRLVAAWLGPYDGTTHNVEARVLAADGTPITPTFEVSSFSGRTAPQVIATAGGGFAVGWLDSDNSFYVRQYDSSGNATGAEYVEPDTSYHGQAMAARSGGGVVLSWLMNAGDFMTAVDVIRFRQIDASGAAVGAFVDVAHSPGAGVALAIESLPDGGFFVLTEVRNAGGNLLDDTLFGRNLDSSLSGGSETAIHRHKVLVFQTIRITRRSDGHFLAVWLALDGSLNGVFGQEIDGSGQPLGEPLVTINVDRTAAGDVPLVASSPSGRRSLVVWRGDQDDPAATVFGRLICDPADADCPICLGVPDTPDDDVDGIPDGCDACVGTGGEHVLTSSRLHIAADPLVVAQVIEYSPSQIVIKGDLPLDAGAPAFDQFALDTVGGRLRIEGTQGALILDAELTAQASTMPRMVGWSLGGSGRVWRYFGTLEYYAPYKIHALTLHEKTRDGQRRIRFKAIGSGEVYPYPFVAEDIPVRLTIELGGLAGPQVTCGEIQFAGDECTYRERNAIDCSY